MPLTMRVALAYVIALFVFGAAVTSACRADFVVYSFPGGGLEVVFEGEVRVSSHTVKLRHAKFGEIILDRSDVFVLDVESPTKDLNTEMMRAVEAKNATELARLARRALKLGFIKPFLKAMSAVKELDPQHSGAKAVDAMIPKIAKPISESPSEEEKFRKLVIRPELKIKRSEHFILLTDLDKEPGTKPGSLLIDERLELMEKVYQGFLYLFASHGVQLQVPRERMMVVLFSEKAEFDREAAQTSATLVNASGFWDSRKNVSYFFEHSTSPEYVLLQKLVDELNGAVKTAMKARMAGRGDLKRFVKSLELLMKVIREDSNVTVLTHEMTHQLAGSTNLLPRDRPIPQWVHEGLATYFESPKNAGWAGMGAVNEERLIWYRSLIDKNPAFTADIVYSNRVFSQAKTTAEMLDGYATAWTLTHYMMEKRFDDLMRFYKLLQEQPSFSLLTVLLENPKSATPVGELFEKAIGGKKKAELFNAEWRQHTKTLRTELAEAIKREQDKRLQRKMR